MLALANDSALEAQDDGDPGLPSPTLPPPQLSSEEPWSLSSPLADSGVLLLSESERSLKLVEQPWVSGVRSGEPRAAAIVMSMSGGATDTDQSVCKLPKVSMLRL